MGRLFTILAINPGSTSDDMAVFHGDEVAVQATARYSPADLQPFDGQPVTAQMQFRAQWLRQTLAEHDGAVGSLDAVIGRGGLIRPVRGGTYAVNERLLADLHAGVMGNHPSNLGGILAHQLALDSGIPAFIADPVVVDELEPVARLSGMPGNPRVSIFHALNHKRVGRWAAAKLNKTYEESHMVIVHAGGGISVGAHRMGRVVDVNNALDGGGPFSPQRAGSVPVGELVRMCYSGCFTHAEMRLRIKGRGGLVAYTGTSDVALLHRFIQGAELHAAERAQLLPDLTPSQASDAIEAMVYQIAKEVGAMATALGGHVDTIVLTGGLAYANELIVEPLKRKTAWIAPMLVFPGGDELGALRDAAQRVLDGSEAAQVYPL